MNIKMWGSVPPRALISTVFNHMVKTVVILCALFNHLIKKWLPYEHFTSSWTIAMNIAMWGSVPPGAHITTVFSIIWLQRCSSYVHSFNDIFWKVFILCVFFETIQLKIVYLVCNRLIIFVYHMIHQVFILSVMF